MKFARAIWKLLVGIKDGLVLLLLILFFCRPLWRIVGASRADQGTACSTSTSTAASSSSRAAANGPTSPVRPRAQAVSVCAISSSRSTRPRTTAGSRRLHSISTASPAAARPRSAISRRPSVGCAPSGKPVIAYGVGFTDDGYALASAASEIWLNPLGGVLISGPGGSNLYYKGLLDKLGVTANVYRVGTYKSAVEPYIRNDMSPEARQNYTALDQGSAGTGSKESESRRGPKA